MLEENLFLLIVMAFYGCMGGYLLLTWYRNRNKIHVRIKRAMGEQKKLIKPTETQGEPKLSIIKGRGRTPWEPTFNQKCLYQIPITWGLRKAWAVDVFEGAKKCVEYDYEGEAVKMGLLSPADIAAFAEAQILKRLSRSEKVELPTLFWLILAASILSCVLSLLSARKLGVF